ncbi:MAG: DNA mismatch repair protein MutT, partial [Microbacterium sp.]|nr:DNA mismatch repair protein MutT [Microbacterium sp.]
MDLRVAAYGVVTDEGGRLLLARWIEGRRTAW